MYCGKGCGWNCTHTSCYHAAFTSNPASFPSALPVTHLYHPRIEKEQYHTRLIPHTSNNSPVAHSSIVSSSNSMLSLDKSKLLAICEQHEHVVAHPTVAAFLCDLKNLLNYDGGPGLVITHPSFLIQIFLIYLT